MSQHPIPKGKGRDPLTLRQRRGRGGRLVLGALLILVMLAELLVSGADWGLWGSARWRPLSYQYGAFWAGILHGWRPNYAAQPYAMFVSYGFLHAGIGHMLGNLLATLMLGRLLLVQMRPGWLIAIWIGGLLGGAAMFGLLASTPAPMVGASGAIFGFAGALILERWREDRRFDNRATRRALTSILVLAVLNLVMWLGMSGALAWETHLGGFIGGAVVALFLRRGR